MEAQLLTSKLTFSEMLDNEIAMETDDVEMAVEEVEEPMYRLQLALDATERKFRRACEQIVLLNYKLSGMQARYDVAREKNLRTFRYSYRLQLAVIEGAKNVYHDYAVLQAERIRSLQMEIFGEIPDEEDEDPDVMEEEGQVWGEPTSPWTTKTLHGEPIPWTCHWSTHCRTHGRYTHRRQISYGKPTWTNNVNDLRATVCNSEYTFEMFKFLKLSCTFWSHHI